ncbi:hypothetical protein HY213_04260 [Candidatus Peregrinibacteria bacterium]|nr:hypothetical protein [Candidatus Peregrinibacteria bacterium]
MSPLHENEPGELGDELSEKELQDLHMRFWTLTQEGHGDLPQSLEDFLAFTEWWHRASEGMRSNLRNKIHVAYEKILDAAVQRGLPILEKYLKPEK